MENVISSAIENSKVLIVRYSAGEREVEPYTLGIGTSGNLLLRAYQRAGASESGFREGWKLFKVDEFVSVDKIDEEFTARHGYKRGDKAMVTIIKEI